MYRRRPALEVFLVHPGGPYFARRDDGVWSLPKGLVAAGEDLLTTARREFGEETGFSTPESGYLELGQVQQTNKIVHAWAFEGERDPESIVSNSFEMEWPRRSGRKRSFPEVDRASYFTIQQARQKIIRAQFELIERLRELLGGA